MLYGMSAHEKILSRTRVFQNRILTLDNETFILPSGVKATFAVVRHPGAVAIVPMLNSRDVVLIRQYRHAVGGYLYEIPAGTLERGEAPLSCAKRELIEETGYRASRLKKLATFYTAPGFCNELMHLYLATGLRPAKGDQDTDEVIRPVKVPLKKIGSMIKSGRIRDAKSLVGLMWITRRVKE